MERGNSGRYVLRLYVTGTTPNSQRAIENVKRLCTDHLAGRYELEVIDLYQNPVMARDSQGSPPPPSSRSCLRRCAGSSATCPLPRSC